MAISYFMPILSAIFVAIATIKFKTMPKFYTSAILQMKLVKSKFQFFAPKGAILAP